MYEDILQVSYFKKNVLEEFILNFFFKFTIKFNWET